MRTFPDTDGETSGYVAAVRYDSGDGSIPLIRLPGWHLTFADAKARARRVADAMKAAGETGLFAHVAFGGVHSTVMQFDGTTRSILQGSAPPPAGIVPPDE